MKRCLPLCLYVVPALAGLYLLGAAALSLCFSASAVSVAAPGGGTLQVITGGQADAALSGVVFWLVAVATPLFLLCISYVNGNHDPWRGISRAKRWGIPGAFALAFLLSVVWLLRGSVFRPLFLAFLPTGILALFALVQSFLLLHNLRKAK